MTTGPAEPAAEPAPPGSYFQLLLTLVLSFALSTLPRFGVPARILIGALGITMAASALRSVWGNRRIVGTAMGLAAGFALTAIAELVAPSPRLHAVSDLLLIGLLATVGGSIIHHVARSTRITMDTIYGAACVYFMIGIFWSALYRLVYLVDPGAFHFATAGQAGAGSLEAWFGYYSMITLTTIGYGDITPVSPVARSLAMLEGLMGQLYLAITIARLVGLQIASAMKGDPPA